MKINNFCTLSDYKQETSELVLSLDVIFHLIENEVFENYMHNLFKASKKFIMIYSSNQEAQENITSLHFRHRKFTGWVETNYPNWILSETIKNPFPYDGSDPNNCSVSDYFIYKLK